MGQSSNTEFTTADAIVRELVNEGVEKVFGIVSIHNMPIYDAIKRDGRIQLITARGESGAVNMADGYARVTGKIGVVITSTGAGAGNAAGSLTEAWNKGVPLLHITGEVSSPYLGTGKRYIHECKDQQAMMDGASKKSYLLKNPLQITPIIREAISEAKQLPSGPITVNIPIDYQSIIVPESNIINTMNDNIKEDLDINIPEEVIEKIAKSKRPAIWAGGGVIIADAAKEFTKFAETIGAAVITSESGKGAIPENHPLCIGHFAFYEDTQKLLKNSDLLISIGVKFRGNETTNWNVKIPDVHIGIDADPQAFNLNYPVNHGLIGDAKGILKELLSSISDLNIDKKDTYRAEIKDVREKVRSILEDKIGPYKEIAKGIRRYLPNNGILVRDVTVPASLWGSRLINIYEARTSIHASGGGIGQGLPTAIGAQLGAPNQTVVLMVGDGGFMLNVGELATASQENLPLIIILFDDAGYGVLRGIQDATYGRRVAVDLNSPDFVKLGEAMGIDSTEVGSSEAFNQAFEKAVSNKKPSLIVINMDEVGPMSEPYQGSPAIANSFRPREFKN